jgi:hypothetical protein
MRSILVAIALTGLLAPAAPASTFGLDAHAAAKKKAKKKKPLIATVNGTFTIREDNPDGFGNDNGPNSQELKLVIKNAEIPFRAGNRRSAADTASVRFAYTAEASTQDRSYAAGCDSEFRKTTGTWTGQTTVTVRETNWLVTNGKSKKYGGWQVLVAPPERGIELESTGSYLEWESILMTNCLTVPANEPLGSWSPSFAKPDGLGKLASDNRSVPLTAIDTEVGQKGTANGSLKFNKSVG